MVFFISSSIAQATLLDICDLSQRSVDASAVSDSSQIKSYQAKLKKECELSNQYKSLNEKLRNSNQIGLTDIAEYQAIRFVQRSWLNDAAQAQKPVEIIYQIFKDQYALPFSQQSGAVWDDWAVGIQQLEPMIKSFKAGQSFDLATLKKIHRGLFPFYPLIDEHGNFAHEPNPGVMKPTISNATDTYWWALETDSEIASAKTIVERENAYYKKLGLLTDVPNGVPEYASHILDVRLAEKRGEASQKVTALFSGSDVVNRQNTELILGMVDALIKKARLGQHMIWKGLLFTPGELAYFVQQAYVRVHPFYEGNGRTSRFLQELILVSFNLPHGASGDLMDIDALTENGEYYMKAIEANFSLLQRMKSCSDEYDQIARKKDIRTVEQSRLSYGCRILQDRSSIWASLKNDNEVKNKSKYDQRMQSLAQLERQTNEDHARELARRSGKIVPGIVAAGAAQPQVDPVQECVGKTGSEKERCERFAEIRRKIGK